MVVLFFLLDIIYMNIYLKEDFHFKQVPDNKNLIADKKKKKMEIIKIQEMIIVIISIDCAFNIYISIKTNFFLQKTRLTEHRKACRACGFTRIRVTRTGRLPAPHSRGKQKNIAIEMSRGAEAIGKGIRSLPDWATPHR